jgi:hypothetical protein
VVHDGEIELSLCVAAFCRLGIPLSGCCRIGGDSVAVLILHAKIELFMGALPIASGNDQHYEKQVAPHFPGTVILQEMTCQQTAATTRLTA